MGYLVENFQLADNGVFQHYLQTVSSNNRLNDTDTCNKDGAEAVCERTKAKVIQCSQLKAKSKGYAAE